MEKAYLLTAHQAENQFNTSTVDGLASNEVSQRLNKYGPNVLKEVNNRHFLAILAAQFTNFLVVILFFASVLSFLLGDIIDGVMILAVVVANASIGFFQEYRVEKTIRHFRKLVTSEVWVKRNGQIIQLPTRNLVPGDLVILEEGQKVPADIRLTSINNLKTIESSLTGESAPIDKITSPLGGNLPISDQTNMLFAGTIISLGKGTGIVIATGMSTEMGKIIRLTSKNRETLTPMQVKLNRLGGVVGKIVIVVAILISIEEILTGHALKDAVMSAVALSVGAIPEGLPAIITVSFALGAKRLLKQKALLRNLPSAETLGSTDVICVDKTGTLTTGIMSVRKIYYDNQIYSINEHLKEDVALQKKLHTVFQTTALASNAQKSGEDIIGDPTESAFLETVSFTKFNYFDLIKKSTRVKEILFSGDRKMMSVVSQLDGHFLVSTKGALEAVLSHCSKIEKNNQKVALTKADKDKILSIHDQMARDGLRVLAFALKEIPSYETQSEKQLEDNLVFLALQGISDPPREGVKESIATCQQAGIRVVMITGDHLLTAAAIGKELGLEGKTLTGQEFNRLTDGEFEKMAEEIIIYARVTPEHKLRIVKALKKLGHQVAMTGDGVNDAPALEVADIGVSMGKTGTDVAKDASDMILLDDDFTTIVEAVKEGRTIYDNIRKFVNFLLSTNIIEVLVIIGSIAAGWPLPLLPIHLLWINLITDGIPSVALGADPPRKNIMSFSPRYFAQEIISRNLLKTIITIGSISAVIALGIFYLNKESLIHAQTMVFTALVAYELIIIYAIRRKYSLSLLSNKFLLLSVAISFTLQLLILYLPVHIMGISLQTLFKIQPLNIVDWAYLIGFGAVLFILLRIFTPKSAEFAG